MSERTRANVLCQRLDDIGAGHLLALVCDVITEAKAEEREACAMLADGKASIARRTHAIHSMRPHVERAMLQAETCEEFAVAIRARSKQ